METAAHAEYGCTNAGLGAGGRDNKYNHITPALRELHWLPICFCAQFNVLVFTFKAINSIGPGYLKDCLLHYLPSHVLCTSERAQLVVP